MTDPITPAEAAAADAIDANLSAEAASPNADLVSGNVVPEALSPEETVAQLEAKLATIKAHNASLAIPHAHPVPAVHGTQAEDKPVHTVLPSSPAPLPAQVVTPSALLAAKLAAIPPGAKPVKRKYAYQRNR